jgi:hypothetical protein
VIEKNAQLYKVCEVSNRSARENVRYASACRDATKLSPGRSASPVDMLELGWLRHDKLNISDINLAGPQKCHRNCGLHLCLVLSIEPRALLE